MTVIARIKYGTFQKRLGSARRALKGWNYRLVKSRAIIVHQNQSTAFVIIDIISGNVVAGGSAKAPRLSLSEVEDWYNAQGFLAKIASDGTQLRDVTPDTLTVAQRDIVERIALLEDSERLELVRYLSAQLTVHKYGIE